MARPVLARSDYFPDIFCQIRRILFEYTYQDNARAGGCLIAYCQFAEILVKCQDDPVFPASLMQDFGIRDTGRFLANPYNIVPIFQKIPDNRCRYILIGKQVHPAIFSCGDVE